jgi:hypothetical protein
VKRLIYILFLLSLATAGYSQQVLKVVTRVVEEEYRYSNEFLLEINAEKANIDIKVVDGSVVTLRLKQSVKNKDVRVAERELEFIRFAVKNDKNRLYLHNYAQLDANSKGLSSIVNNEYVLEVPRHCHLKIKNELGQVVVNQLETSMRFQLNYCSLILNDTKGKLYVDSRIGDITLNDCETESEFITDNVSVKLQRCKGSFDIRAQFGSISCLMSENISLLNAHVEQCDVTLINRTSIDFAYAIRVNKGTISALDEVLKENIKIGHNENSLMSKKDNAVGTVIIKSSYGDVNLY